MFLSFGRIEPYSLVHLIEIRLLVPLNEYLVTLVVEADHHDQFGNWRMDCEAKHELI